MLDFLSTKKVQCNFIDNFYVIIVIRRILLVEAVSVFAVSLKTFNIMFGYTGNLHLGRNHVHKSLKQLFSWAKVCINIFFVTILYEQNLSRGQIQVLHYVCWCSFLLFFVNINESASFASIVKIKKLLIVFYWLYKQTNYFNLTITFS